MFDFEYWLRGIRKRGRVRERPVAVRHLRFRVAAVEGFDPHQRRVFRRLPTHIPRPRRHAFDGDFVLQRKLRHGVNDLAFAVPDFDRFRERRSRVQVRIRPPQPANQQEFSIGRRRGGAEDRRIADGLRDRRHIERHDRQLRRGVVIVKGLIVRVLQHVLVRANGCRLAARFLHRRADRREWRFRWFAAFARNQFAQKRIRVGHPRDRVAERGIQRDERDAFHRCRGGTADPELHLGIGGYGSREAEAVRRPLRHADDPLRQRDRPRVPTLDRHQCQPGDMRDASGTVRERIDAEPRQPQLRFRQLGDAGIAHRLDQHQRVPRRVQAECRCGRRVQDIENRLRRLLVRRLPRRIAGRFRKSK